MLIVKRLERQIIKDSFAADLYGMSLHSLNTIITNKENHNFNIDFESLRIGINISSCNLYPSPINYFLLCNVYS